MVSRMALAAGSRIGRFELLTPIGAGGMGQVWRARDERLGRDVALKFLLDGDISDPQSRARFEREALLLASLSDPHVAQLHELLEHDGLPVLVMELLEGETLEERLARRPPMVREALELAVQIAAALEAAHDRGILHRDLKPSNVKVTPQRRIKLLDFGLAKALNPDQMPSSVETRSSPAAPLTGAGMAAGTAPYMSPEQTRGEKVDRRADIWAFGCVLYEMLTGRRAYPGATSADAASAVLTCEPDWSLLPADLPPEVQALLRRCLRKDKAKRLRDAADLRIQLEEALEGGSPAAPGSALPRWRPWARPLGVALLVAGVSAVATLVLVRRDGPGRVSVPRRLTLTLPADAGILHEPAGVLALAPDGRSVVYRGAGRLWRREIDGLEPVPIVGTEDARNPFFSPDGRWLAFHQRGKLRKISLEGGAPIDLCPIPNLRGASWGEDGTIIFPGSNTLGLWRVSAGGGKCEELTRPDTARNENGHRWPQALPGARAILFSIQPLSGREDESRIAVLSLETRTWRTVLEGASFARYLGDGHIVFTRAGTLHAVPFDLRRLQVAGEPRPVLDGVRGSPSGKADFEVTPTGALAYVPGHRQPPDRSLLWVDRHGAREPVTPERRAYKAPRLAPHGSSVAVTVDRPDGVELWLFHIERRTWTRLPGPKDNDAPAFSPDGRRLAFGSNRAGDWNIYATTLDGEGDAARLLEDRAWCYPSSWSPDGRFLLFERRTSESASTAWVLPLEGRSGPRPLEVSPESRACCATFSPDGRWVAYASTASEGSEVWVRPFLEVGPTWQVSREGGNQPVWSRNGRELFYRTGGKRPKMMSVPVEVGRTFRPGQPRALFDDVFHSSAGLPSYDVTGDGRRFLMLEEVEEPVPPPHIVLIPDLPKEIRDQERSRRR